MAQRGSLYDTFIAKVFLGRTRAGVRSAAEGAANSCATAPGAGQTHRERRTGFARYSRAFRGGGNLADKSMRRSGYRCTAGRL